MSQKPETSCDVSVVSVNFKVPDELGMMIESVPAAAAGKTVEIIVVDNASNDGSVEALGARFSHIDLVASPENLGFARGNNLGAARARGRHIALVNPDVVLEPGSLGALVDFLDAHPAAGMVGPKILLPGGEVQSFAGPLPSTWDVLRALPGGRFVDFVGDFLGERVRALRGGGPAARRCGVIHGSCMVIRHDAWLALGGMPTDTFMYGEELLLGHRLQAAGFEVWHLPAVSVLHDHESSANKHFEPHHKALQKRWAHVVARTQILARPSFVAWNAVLASRALTDVVRRRLSGNGTAEALDFFRLHAQALGATRDRPPPAPQRKSAR